MKIEKNKNLLNYNFYQIKARAKYFVELKSKKDFLEIFEWIKKNKVKKYHILGEGANTIFVTEKYDGLMIKISNSFLKWDFFDDEGGRSSPGRIGLKKEFQVEVGAGKSWDRFLATCQRKEFYEIQSMADIPGSVGAAVFGNIGAFGSEIKKYVFGVWVFDIEKKGFVFLENNDLKFSYRNSFLKENREKYIVYSVIFDFSPKFQKKMNEKYADGEYFSLKHFAKKHGLKNLKKSEIRKFIKKTRRSVYPNLKKFPNVGSTFKNTEITKTQLKKILKKYPDMPNWNLENGKVKIPTAFIFDKILNLKGKRFGNIEIDKIRPLFFTNMGGATGDEFYKLCQKIKRMTKEKVDVGLEEEVYFVK